MIETTIVEDLLFPNGVQHADRHCDYHGRRQIKAEIGSKVGSIIVQVRFDGGQGSPAIQII